MQGGVMTEACLTLKQSPLDYYPMWSTLKSWVIGSVYRPNTNTPAHPGRQIPAFPKIHERRRYPSCSYSATPPSGGAGIQLAPTPRASVFHSMLNAYLQANCAPELFALICARKLCSRTPHTEIPSVPTPGSIIIAMGSDLVEGACSELACRATRGLDLLHIV